MTSGLAKGQTEPLLSAICGCWSKSAFRRADNHHTRKPWLARGCRFDDLRPPASTTGAQMTVGSSDESIEVSVWSEKSASASTKLASGLLEPSAHAEGLLTLRAPLKCELRSGLSVGITCERVSTGEFHLGVDENERLVSMGKYAGLLAVRFFPAGHSSYVVNIERIGKRHGA